jgi:hypothetical protein
MSPDDDGPGWDMQAAYEAMEWYETHQPMFGSHQGITTAPSKEKRNGIHESGTEEKQTPFRPDWP